jgi:hypothetical protein
LGSPKGKRLQSEPDPFERIILKLIFLKILMKM